MPILARTVEYYRCQFKCGIKAKEHYKMLLHEENCYCNPKNKTCRICENCSVDSDNMYCNFKKISIINREKPHKVYNFNGDIIWEERHNKMDDIIFDEKLWNENLIHNLNRPFPKKNCEHFILSKKVF